MLKKDFFREIKKNIGRFISILFIVMLGTAFFAGIRSTNHDMKFSADTFFDSTHLMDVRVLGTLGLTDADLEDMAAVEGVAAVTGGHSMEVLSRTEEHELVLTLIGQTEGVNEVALVEGRLPENKQECVADILLLDRMGYELGDEIVVASGTEEELSDSLNQDTFTIVGFGSLPYHIDLNRGTCAIGDGAVDAFLVVDMSVFESDIYSEAYVQIEGAEALPWYGTEYQEKSDAVTEKLEAIADNACRRRYESIYKEVDDQLSDARQEVLDGEEKLAEGRKELDDGWAEYNQGLSDLTDGEQQLADAEAAFAEAEAQIAKSEQQLTEGEQQLAAGRQELNAGLAQLEAGEAEYYRNKVEFDQRKSEYEAGVAAYEAGELDYAQKKAAYDAGAEIPLELLTAMRAQLDQTKAELAAAEVMMQQGQIQLDAASAELASSRQQLEAGLATLAEKEGELAEGRRTLEEGKLALEENRGTLESSRQELEEGRADLEEAYTTLTEGEAEYQKQYEENMPKLQDAKEEIQKAEEELAELNVPSWYVLDRDMISSIVSYESDANRMKSLGNVFPVFFFLVAALISLTAMTRMVEEQRLAAGTLKALGYSSGLIAMKYFAYAMLATVTGGVLGVIIGEKTLPAVVMTAYHMLYTGMPVHLVPLNWNQGILAVAAAAASTGIATLAACFATLKAKPAELMRPEAPKSGRRVFLEHIPFLWKHLNFTQKSTVRNLFRYKKRFFMTIIGIGGCMSLMLVGYGLQDCITVVAKNQYKTIFKYQANLTLNEKAEPEEMEEFLETVSARDDIEEYTRLYQMSVDLEAGNKTRNAFLFVPEDTEKISDFLRLGNRKTHQTYDYPTEGVALAEKTADMLHVSVGDTIYIVNSDDHTRVPVEVVNVVENYVLHYAFLAPATYEELYGQMPEYNSMYLRYDDCSESHEELLAKELMEEDACLGIAFERNLNRTIDDMLKSLGMVIYVLIISAAALAFVVLYNLNSINITERQRELATLKVLGFYDGEVAMYVFRENVILTLIGIVAGLFMGTALQWFTISTVEVDLMMFGRRIGLRSYLIAALLTLVFSLFINLCMHHRLKKINMIEALKSVE